MAAPAPQTGTFPPAAPTTMTQVIPSYLYQEYDDDPDLQSFVQAQNNLAQGYVAWFAQTSLGDYTAASGPLLDWVAAGLYGFERPSLSSGIFRSIGPYNTFAFNTWPFSRIRRVGPSDVTVTSDDVYKRIITWNFYKGDGNRFNVRWLKRRIMRFLIGENGSAPNIDQTYAISVTFGGAGLVSVRIGGGGRRIVGGALYGAMGFNRVAFNSLRTVPVPGSNPFPNDFVLKEAMDGGALQLPFQLEFVVTVPPGV